MSTASVEGYRLSPQQRRLHELSEGGFPVRSRVVVRIDGPLGPEELESALVRAAQRHDSLRSSLQPAPGLRHPLQVVGGEVELDWRRIEVTADPGSLDGEGGGGESALRARLRRLAAERHELLLEASALWADPRSLVQLITEAASILDGAEPEEPVQYLAYGEYQENLLSEPEDPRGPEHWRQVVDGFQPLSLPGSRPVPEEAAEPGSAGLRTRCWSLGEPGRRLVNSADGPEEAEARVVALVAALLHRLAGTGAVHLALLADGRLFEDLEASVGPFARWLPLRLSLDEDAAFPAVVRRAERAVGDALAWQEYFPGFGHPEAPPLPKVGLSLVRRLPSVRGGKVELRVEGVEAALEPIPVQLQLEVSDGVEATLRYDPRHLDDEAAADLAERFQAMAASVAGSPQAAIADLDLLGRRDRARLDALNEASRTASPGRHRLLHQAIAEQAARTPEAVAVEAPGGSLTYGQLHRLAEALAARIRQAGGGPETVVAVGCGRSAELVVGMLAVLRAGAAYVPLDPADPVERLRYLVHDSEAVLVLAPDPLADELGGVGVPLLSLDGVADPARLPAQESGRGGEETPVEPDGLAYVLYTSGSTGRPKGVMVSHRSALAYLEWAVEAYGVGPGTVAPVHSPVGFDLTVTALFAPLLAGGTVHLVPEEGGVEALAAALAAGRELGLFKLTPSHLDLLGQLLGESVAGRVGTLVVGGEALSGGSVTDWCRRVPTERVVNEYGPTETVVGCCVHRWSSDDGEGPVPIGRPAAGARLYVASPRFRRVPPGTTGELLIAGPAVARGYRGRPALTAQRFLPDPWSDLPGGRLYRSGDRVVLDDDGGLRFLGRLDHQLKVRGFRVEPGEIESVLRSLPTVREAAVGLRPGAGGTPRLVAWVVVASGASLDSAALLRDLAQRLPEHLVPAVVVEVPALPLTSRGKVDREALPEPEERSPRRSDLALPRDTLETALVRLWEEVLGVRPIGIREDFFALGGHSMLAVRMMVQVRERLGREVPLASLVYGESTVERLAALLREHPEGVPWQPRVQLARGAGRPLFLVHPHGGTVLCYLDLARRLSGRVPVHGLVARGREGDLSPLTRIQQMAALYTEEVRKLQPEGPYRLGGWSLGGTIAWEMARQLREAGQDVESLVVIDTDFRPFPPIEDDGAFLLEMVGEELELRAEDLTGLDLRSMLELAVERGRERQGDDAGMDLDGLERYFVYYKKMYNAARRYRFERQPVPVTLFLSSQHVDEEPLDPTFGLHGLAAAGMEVVVVPGRHDAILQEPAVTVLASHLARRFAGDGKQEPHA